LAHGHEIYKDDCAAIGGSELGFKDERVGSVAALDSNLRFRSNGRRGDLPAAIVGIAKERCKTRRRVEPRPAQPVNRAIL
jgi:hypothetical protein